MEKKIPTFLAAVSAAAFALTAIYIWGLSIGVGKDISQFVVITDYVSLAAQWLTPIVGVGLLINTIGLFLGKKEWILQVLIVVFLLVVVILATSSKSVSSTTTTVLIILSIGTIASVIFTSLALYVLIKEYEDCLAKTTLLLITGFTVFSFTRGLARGVGSNTPSNRPATVVLSEGGTKATGEIVAVFSNYTLLISNDDGGLIVIPKDEISSISYAPKQNGQNPKNRFER